MKLIIINGPNLNLLGRREPQFYGSKSFDEKLKELRSKFSSITIDYFQSNHEGELIDKLQEVGYSYDGIILNAAAYSHTSIAIADTVAAIDCEVVEVHISNIYKREEYRHHSFISEHARGFICGFGLESYDLAIQSFN